MWGIRGLTPRYLLFSKDGYSVRQYDIMRHAIVYYVKIFFYLTFIPVRDWSLITGRGGLQNGKIAGPKLFAPPPQDRVKLFAPPL